MKLSIIIPVFNEEKTITKVLNKVLGIKIPGVTKEIIVIDDGSTDKTVSEIKKMLRKSRSFRLVERKTNQGKGAAIKTGVKEASGEYIIIQDADLEYNPEDIIRLVEPIKNKTAEVVYGTRLRQVPKAAFEHWLFMLHFLGNRFLSFVTSVLYQQWVTDMETGYKLFPRRALDNISLESKRFDFEPEITAKLLRSGYKIHELPIETKPRHYSEGKKIRTFHDGSIAIWTLFKYRFVK